MKSKDYHALAMELVAKVRQDYRDKKFSRHFKRLTLRIALDKKFRVEGGWSEYEITLDEEKKF